MPEYSPYTNPTEVLHEYGAWFCALCLRAMRSHAMRLLNDSGGYSPKSVSAGELIQTLSEYDDSSAQTWLDEHHIPSFDQCNEYLALIMSVIHKRIDETFEKLNGINVESVTPSESLKQAFELSETELHILICLVLVQFDDKYARAFRYVFGTAENAHVTVGSILLLFDFANAIDIRSAFLPDSALVRNALIQFIPLENWGNETPLNNSPVFASNRIVSYLLGEPGIVDIVGCKRLEPYPNKGTKSLSIEREIKKTIQKKRFRVALLGRDGFGRTSAFVRTAEKIHAHVFELDLSAFAQNKYHADDIRRMISIIIREIKIQHALLLIRATKIDGDQFLEQNAFLIHQCLCSHTNDAFAVILSRQTVLSRALFGELNEIDFPAPLRENQSEYWLGALSDYLPKDRASEIANDMSMGYCLSESEIRGVIEQTLARRANLPTKLALTTDLLTETLNKTRGHKLEGLATLRSTNLFLKDIVLSNDIRNVLQEVLAYAKYRDTVMQDWGFNKYNLSGAGLSVLLSGVPGTGKTMTALVLAHELRKGLYVVDLSRVVDKYIGETEKRLAMIFDEAEQSQAVLLFDEADSLFAKRTDVKSSNDRYANLEVNYLLQRLEAYSGVSILTTNFGGGLDEALARRIQFKIDFPMPDLEQRIKLWKRLIPPAAPVHPNISFTALAEYFEMSGGHIKNAIFRAAIQAAMHNSDITHDLLWDAAIQEYREMGHVIRNETSIKGRS